MKKLILSTLLVLSLFAVSCTPRTQESSSAPNSDSSSTLPIETTLDLQVVTNISNNFEATYSIGTEIGFYQMSEQKIYYVDYATASRLPLCSAPNCEHNDESCTAFFNGNGILFLDNDQKNLFYFGSNGDGSQAQSDEEHTMLNRDLLYRMELSGSGRELVYDFGAGKVFNQGTIVASDEKLYFIYSTNENNEHKRYLGELNVTVGNLTAIKEMEPSEYIVSAYDNTIVIENNGNISRYDLLSGETVSAYEFSQETEKGAFLADGLYVYDSLSGEIKVTSLTTNETKTIATISGTTESAYIRFINNNYLEIGKYNGGNQENQIIDIATGQVYSPRLTLQREWTIDGEVPMPIIGASSDLVLTIVKSVEQEVTAYDPGGLPYTMLAPVDIIALMSWEDYLKSTPEYIYVEDFTDLADTE